MASYYRNYYDHQHDYDDEQSVADSQTDLYGYRNNKLRPQRQNGPSMVSAVFDRPSRQARKNNRGPMDHRRSSFMDQGFYHLPENDQGNGFNYTYQQPRHSRPHSSSYKSNESVTSPAEYQHYYQDQQQQQQQQHGRRRGSQGNIQYHDYPTTPEDERNNFLYHDQSFTASSEEVANYSAAIMNQHNGMYTVPDSQHSGATLDDDDGDSFIEDTTTQRNTLINSESSAPATGAHYHQQTISPQMEDQVSPLQLTSPFEPPLAQQLQKPETFMDQSNSSHPVEKKKWFKSIVSTALIIKKKAQNLKRDDVSKGNSAMHQQQQQAMYRNTSSPSIQVISAGNNGSVGDVLDSRQQQELITQLYQSPPPAPGSNAALLPEKTKITSLDRIWVFRLVEETNTASHSSSIAWIGFDFENQLRIEQHIKDLELRPEDGRLALYDSHIRHKSMPVIVTPNDNKGYYFADVHQTDLITLEITFIENDHQKITFVYRV
ncbi:hypothetical protein MAM1_0187d07560 [Mucor ambiguus]|uniref:Uncharacterized protein n=1 Tax=Mucor ambiguus TaxID=91626 RepID=A0A0C9N0E0_9FUNG|nr:hypothetical protein MAM1_0187d07560 [Mucor ambiguus]